MFIHRVRIKNFRGIKDLEIFFDKFTVLIGENNVGKTSVLDALKIVLDRNRSSSKQNSFVISDLHLAEDSSRPQNAEPIEITIEFRETQENRLPVVASEKFGGLLQFFDIENELNSITLKVTTDFDTINDQKSPKYAFLDLTEAELPPKRQEENQFLQSVQFFSLSALRDIEREFGLRGRFWSGFVKSLKPSEEQESKIEKLLSEVNLEVIEANEEIKNVKESIKKVANLVSLSHNDTVELESIPTRIHELNNVLVNLRTPQGARLPLKSHGAGTQSLAILTLFEAFVIEMLNRNKDDFVMPILAVEEPETHLHPSAARSLGAFLSEMSGQKIVTSHSADFVSNVPLESIRRLYSKNENSGIGLVTSDHFEGRKIKRFVTSSNSKVVFSKCWLLVEGYTEMIMLPAFFKSMGHDIDGLGIATIEYSSYGYATLYAKIADKLGIEWFVLADGDSKGNDYYNNIIQYLRGENREIEVNERVLRLTSETIELEFYNNNFQSFYENLYPEDKDILETIKNFNSRTKIRHAYDLIDYIEMKDAVLPESIKQVVKNAVKLSGSKNA